MSPRYDLTPHGEPYEVESTGYALVKWGGIIGSMAAVGLVAFIGGGPILGGGGSGGVVRAPVTVASAAGNPVDWQNNWLTFSDTAPNDSITRVAQGGDAQNQADSTVMYDYGALIEFTSGDRDTLAALVPVAAAPGVWPTGMGHVMRIKISGAATATQFAVDTLPLPAVGEFQFRRHYMALAADSGFNPADQHYFHHGETYGTWWDLNILEAGPPFGVTGDSLYRVRLLQNVNSSTEALGYLNADSTKTHTVYMIETREEAVSDTTLRVVARMYRMDAGPTHTLWRDTADFRWECLNNGTTDCNGLTNPWELLVGIASRNDQFRRLEYGYNGSAPSPTNSNSFEYIGGVAVRTTSDGSDWIGPFCTPSNECN